MRDLWEASIAIGTGPTVARAEANEYSEPALT